MNTDKDRLENFKGNIYVCGFMASGKSTLAKSLAKKLKRECCDLDELIVEKEGKSIRQIFEEQGEAYFREKEWEYLLELTRNFEGIVSLGGGALHNQHVVDHLKVSGLIVFVETTLEEITKRVYNSSERPVLFDEGGKIKPKETLFAELKTLYLAREDLYKQAQIHIKTQLYNSVDEMTEILTVKISQHV